MVRSPKQTESPKAEEPTERPRRRRWLMVGVGLALFGLLFVSTSYESYASLYDADYIGSQRCGECHTQVYGEWQHSPHALMARDATAATVVGDFDQHQWFLPPEARQGHDPKIPFAIMSKQGDRYTMSMWDPRQRKHVAHSVDMVIGYQYRQVYLHREAGGVLRRLPLQWSLKRGQYFPYWNLQEKSLPTGRDLWAQMRSANSAWNLFCARCHTTNLREISKNADHTRAETHWSEAGIGCEACHGPGSAHANYFAGNYVNRLAAFVNSKVRGESVAYIANGPKLTKGQDMSVCARCHGPDILMSTTAIYRDYEPGYSKSGKINDLSPHFLETKLEAGRTHPATMECWDDARPKGVGMLFRSFLESKCYQEAEARCYDCHNPHNNKVPAKAGLLAASQGSNDYCLQCHTELRGKEAEHSHHVAGEAGSFCYDCHMPKDIVNMVGGYPRLTRTHNMSSIPNPRSTIRHGTKGAPNACNECHKDKTPQWADRWMRQWWK